MNDVLQKQSPAWVSFSYLCLGIAAFMLASGIYMMPLDLWGKGYLTMGILMLVQTVVNVTKTLRDNDEAEKMARRMDEARTEKMLLGINRGETN